MSERPSAEQRVRASIGSTPEEYARLQRLNANYRARFGFPFLFAVKGSTKDDVLTALEARVGHDRKTPSLRKRCVRCTGLRGSASRTSGGGLVERLASGPNDHYYGKADVTVYRLIRDGGAPTGRNPVFGANVKMLTWGGAFWPTYLQAATIRDSSRPIR